MAENEEHHIRTGSKDNYRPPRIGASRRYLLGALIGVVVLYLLFFMQLPFFIFMPGTAEAVGPMVQIKQGADAEAGSLMLTTVRVTDANVLNYTAALFNKYQEIQRKESVFREGESESEYSQRQEYVMLTSQASAIQAAYSKAGVPFHIKHEGVMVLKTVAGMPAEQVFKPGDVLLQVDDKPIGESDELIQYVSAKKAGEQVKLAFKRGDKELSQTLALQLLPQEAGDQSAPRAGLGVVPADMQAVEADDAQKQISIQAGEIGGPSAGLMFSLEIYNQLTPGDITKGHRIAGTGTIEADGTVGVIGGIQHKIVAADKAGAEIFFAPKDLTLEDGSQIRNYSDAVARAQEIGSKMKIVEVSTMDDALRYLQELPAP